MPVTSPIYSPRGCLHRTSPLRKFFRPAFQLLSRRDLSHSPKSFFQGRLRRLGRALQRVSPACCCLVAFSLLGCWQDDSACLHTCPSCRRISCCLAKWEEDGQEGTDAQLSCLCPLSGVWYHHARGSAYGFRWTAWHLSDVPLPSGRLSGRPDARHFAWLCHQQKRSSTAGTLDSTATGLEHMAAKHKIKYWAH